MESICDGVTSSCLESDLQSHQQTHTPFYPFLCIFLRLLRSPLCHEKWVQNLTLYGSNGICDICKCRSSQSASWISFVVGSIWQSNNVSFRRKLYFERFQRIGEASNPGPSVDRPTKDFLNLYHCNPTSLLGKENHFDHMLDGIHFIAETSATQTAQKICTARFKSKNLKCLWSSPMTAYKQSAANLRGHSGGTALISPFPMHRGLEPVPSYLQKADRFVDGVVQYFPHLYMYCAVVYGPHINHRYCNPRTIMNQIMNFVSQKGVRYQGPACISGDFNCKLTDIECWPALRAAGWVDAAELSAVKNNHPIEGTSHDNARHSFILCNRQLAAALIDCRTIKQHLFSVHPVLHARFDYKAAIQSYTQWKLPKSFDRYLIDTQTAEHFAQSQCVGKKPKHDLAFHHDDIATLSHSWTCIAEQTLAAAAVDVEGKPIKVRPGHMGRSSNNPFVVQPAAMPIIPRPREGDHQPISEQGSIELRRWGKQLHRLQSLVRQYSSYNQTGNQNAFGQLNSLWVKILAAKGFQSQFQQWILETDLGHVPLNLPTFEYCCDLKNLFAQWYTTQEHAIWLQRTKLKQLEIIVDIPQGGRLAFQQIRDDARPPIHAIHYKREATMIKTRCKKEGAHCVRLQPGHNLVLGPICFHEQMVNITQVHPDRIFFDRKVKWRSTNLQLSQEDFTMDPPTMHQHLHQAWSPYFCRDKVDEDQHTWEEAITFLEHVQDFPIMAHQPITGQQLYHAVKKTKLASSRGGDGFSTLDLRRLPMSLWELMASIFTKIEQKHLWPEAWTLAKTLCLPDIRPITVMSKMYRVWGKIRGGQVADHLASHIPKTIGGPCAQVSSEMIAFYTADRIEEAISNKTPLSGVVLDIIKCYNSIPRGPLKLLLCRAYNKLQFREQSLLDAILTGKHITNELITKFQPRQDEKCVLCGQTDSRKHRFFHCPALAETREKYKSTLDSVKKWEPTQQTFALCPYDHNLEKFHLENQNLCFEYVIPSTNNDVQHLFVDGTAFFNDHPGLVIAGAAVVAFQPNTTYSHLVCRQRVPGIIQNSYIGELFAILLALNHAWCVHIYSDCQALVEEITFVLQNRTLPPQWCQTHPVLWHLVARRLLHRPSHCVHIQKVTAHQNWKLISQADLRWQAYVNNRVDYHAKQSIISDNSDTYKVRADSYQRQKLLTQTTIEYYAYLSDISKIIVDSKPKKVHIIENNFDPHQDKLQPCMHAHVVHNQHIEVAEYQQFPWGPIFLWRLQQWANQLTWSCHEGGCDKDISDIELTVDYILYTNSEPPVNLSKGQEKQYGVHSVWRLRDLNLEADAMGTVPLNQHVQLFRRAIQWMNKHPKFQLFPCQTKRKVDSLKPLGLSAWHRGYVCRPVLACGERTLTAVRGYFITDSGTRRDLSQPFNVHGTCKIQHPPDFT